MVARTCIILYTLVTLYIYSTCENFVYSQVRFSDQLKLESVKKHGQYLHASSARFTLGAAGYNVLSDW